MLSNDNGMGTTMLVSPNGGGNGFFGDQGGWWIILLFILLAGGNGFGYGNGGEMQRGFDQSAVMNGISGLNNTVAAGFAGSEVESCNRAMDAMQTAYTNQISNLQGFNSLQSQLASCCCENRLATTQTQSVVQAEGAATRLAIQNQTQAILDKMCQQEIDALKTQNANLQTQLNMANLAASQSAQTAQLIADNTAQTQYVVNRIAPYPQPAYIVANPAAAQGYYGCGCGA